MKLRSREMLKQYLLMKGVSGRGLAAQAGLSHSTVNHLITGRRAGCSERTGRAIETALDCPPGLLFVS